MIRVPKQFNGAFITRHFFPSFLENDNVSAINSGYCYDWAYYGHRLFGADLWTTDYHAWCRYGQKYHDSETGKYGVNNFMNLGCNRRNAFPLPWEEKAPQSLSLEDFKAFWKPYSDRAAHNHWKSSLEPKLRKILGKLYQEATPIFQPLVEIAGNIQEAKVG